MSETSAPHLLPSLCDAEGFVWRLMDELPLMALWLNSDGQIVYANRGACRRLGYTRAELLGSPISLITPNYPYENFSSYMCEHRQKRVMRFELEHRTKTGESFPAEVQASYACLDGVELLLAGVVDISERRNYEDRVLDAMTACKRRETKVRALIQGARNGVIPVEDLLAILDE